MLIRRPIPNSSTLFGSCDFEAGELITHAQSCLWIVGWSKLADALLAGKKPHSQLGAAMAGMDYDMFSTLLDQGSKEMGDLRQAAKPGNFGFPGGMGEAKMVLQQRMQGPDTVVDADTVYKGLRFCILMNGAAACGTTKVREWKKRPIKPTCLECIKCAAKLKEHWLRTYPENAEYFKYVTHQVEEVGYVVQHVDKRIRAGVNFNSAANGYFQALLARAAKLALIRASKECYVVKDSPLYGSRIIVFQHDEIIAEHPEHIAAEACERLSEIMVQALRETCPDLAPACRAEPTLMARWWKNAKQVRDSAGRLIPWEPKP